MEHYFFLWACKGCYEQYSTADIKKCSLCGCKEFVDLTDDDAAVKANVEFAKRRLDELSRV